jgi:DNA-binding NtrC family response regulator
MMQFMDYSWPGNIRELENLLTRAMALSTGPDLSLEEIESYFAEKETGGTRRGGDATLAEAEKKHIEESLERFGWNISRTARELDISPTTLRKKISDFNLTPARRFRDRHS